MGAQSATGTGLGPSGKVTVKELAILANGPVIMAAGVAESTSSAIPTSPETYNGQVSLPPLDGGSELYAIILTPKNATSAYVTEVVETSGNLSGFSFVTSDECEVYYVIVRTGVRPL